MKLVPMLKTWIMKNEGGLSWTKVWAWITGALATIVLLHTQLDLIGIVIPVAMLPIFKFAAIASSIITAIRVRNAASGSATPPTPPTTGK